MKNNRTLIGVVASLVVAGLVIAGLFAVGSPATARRFKADHRRVERLEQLHQVLLQHFVDQGELPDTLRDLNRSVIEGYGGGVDPRFDPETGKIFEYRKLSDRQYEVCANFNTSSDDPRNPNQSVSGYRPVPPEAFLGGYPEYKPGRNCFKRTLTNSEISDFYPGRVPIPDGATVPEPTLSPISPPIQDGPGGTSILIPQAMSEKLNL